MKKLSEQAAQDLKIVLVSLLIYWHFELWKIYGSTS